MKLSERLRDARSGINLTGVQVRELTGIGESSLSEFENGKREPSLSQLQVLASLYKRSLSFFLSEEPVLQETVLWRKRPSEDAESIEASFLRLCEQYHNLETWCGEEVKPCLPELCVADREYDMDEARNLAKRVRNDLQLGDRPAHVLLRVLEEYCGTKVFCMEFQPSGTAASVCSQVTGCSVLLNANNVRWRRNFDLAHELFHLLTWSHFRKQENPGCQVTSNNEEKLADCFASNLLMPREAVEGVVSRRRHDGRLVYEDIFDIAREFDVSVDALMWRLHDIYRRKGDENRTRAEIKKLKSLSPMVEERARENTKAPERPERYRALAIKALRRGEISTGRFAEYLGISRCQAMEYVGQEYTAGEEITFTSA
ncbi:MAG: XRE family transcriptional regulator [bacterium]